MRYKSTNFIRWMKYRTNWFNHWSNFRRKSSEVLVANAESYFQELNVDTYCTRKINAHKWRFYVHDYAI